MPRVDIPAKVTRQPTPTSSTSACPGCSTAGSCGRAARAPTATALRTAIVSVDERSIARIGDARVVRRGDFLGVVASHEYDAIEAAAS